MSSYYTASDETAEKKSAGKIEKGLKRLLIIAAVILAAQFIWLFGITPFVPFSVIEVHAIEGLNRSEIFSLGGIDESSSFFSTNTKQLQNILSGHILVESAVVIKRFPDKLSIFLTPREAAAVTLANTASGQVPLYIDRNGVIFKSANAKDTSQVVSDFPVLSGIENAQLNMRLPNALIPLVANVNKIAAASPELLSAISEIRIERKLWEGFDLVLFPVHSSIRVRIENNLTEEVLRYILLMLSVFETENKKPEEIDFRSGMGSYIVNVN